MAKSSTVISLPQMVDLALNSPEVGIVNFTVLHSLLHVIVQQLELSECNVEFRGSDSERLQNYISTAKPGPIITLTEYTVGPGGKDKEKKKKDSKSKKRDKDEKGKADEAQSEKDSIHSASSYQTVVVVEPASKVSNKISTPHFSVALTKDHLSKIQSDINRLEQQIKELTELPGNIGLIEAIRSSSSEKCSPVLDMFQIMNLCKRMDASEATMQKIITLIEDLVKEQGQPTGMMTEKVSALKEAHADAYTENAFTPTSSAMASSEVKEVKEIREIREVKEDKEVYEKLKILERRIDRIEELLQEEQHGVTDIEESGSKEMKPSKSKQKKGKVGGKKSLKGTGRPSTTKSEKTPESDSIEEDASSENVSPQQHSKEKKPPKKKFIPPESSSEEMPVIVSGIVEGMVLSELPVGEAIGLIQKEIESLKNICNNEFIQALKDIQFLKNKLAGRTAGGYSSQGEKGGEVGADFRFEECMDQINSLDQMYHHEIDLLQERITELEKDIGAIMEQMNMGVMNQSENNDKNVSEISNKINVLTEDLAMVADTVSKLWEDRDSRQSSFDIVVEQIELLKSIKANKEDLEDALADKADACAVNRKVSHDQFDSACDDFSKGIEEALARLTQQEAMWTQALDEIQREIGNKLDRMELTPLRDFINNKLKALQDKFKTISAMKQETEAAGAKSKFLRNLNCISCDKDVVMRKDMDVTQYPPPYAAPANKSMAPYLAYELDQLRKQQKCVPPGKDLNLLENAMKIQKGDQEHVCTRYCGGSHTVTTSQQRVTRMGHFLQQWGPEITPLHETLLKGSDGRVYKGREARLILQVQENVNEVVDEDNKLPLIVQSGIANPKTKHQAVVNIAEAEVEATKMKGSFAVRQSSASIDKRGSVRLSVRTSPDNFANDQKVSMDKRSKDSMSESTKKISGLSMSKNESAEKADVMEG